MVPETSWQTKPTDRFVLKWIKVNLSARITPRLVALRWLRPWMLTLFSMSLGIAGGLLLALELPSPEEAVLFCSSCAEKGLLVLPGKVARHTVVLRPPLLLAEDGLQQIVDALKALRS